MTALKNPKVQEAVVDKGLEVMGKLVDKQLKIIDEAQEKASKFLSKEVRFRDRVSDDDGLSLRTKEQRRISFKKKIIMIKYNSSIWPRAFRLNLSIFGY